MSILLDVKGVTKRYGGLTANADITFDVNQGEILGIIGPNGAGKSTLFDLITGFQPLDAGRVVLRRPRHHRPAPRPHRQPRRRPHLPEAQALPRSHRHRERHRRRARPHRRHEAGARPRAGGAGLRRPAGEAQSLRARALHRPAQAPRTRPRPRHEAAHDPDGRGDGRRRPAHHSGPRRSGARAQAPGRDHRHHRAQHAGDDAHLRPHPGAVRRAAASPSASPRRCARTRPSSMPISGTTTHAA